MYTKFIYLTYYKANFTEDDDLLLVGDDQGYMNFIYINKKILT